MKPDLSLILNLHNETRFLARTLRSSEEAVRYAAAAGITTELVFVLDRPAADTQAWVARYQADCFAAIRSVVVDNGSLGPSRVDGVAIAQGEYVTLADGDDLISFNALAAAMQMARTAGPEAIVLPEYVLEFGDRHYVTAYYGDPVVGAIQTLFSHPFNSRILIRRDRFAAIGCRDIPLGTGYAYEDWHFNSEALARGMRFVMAPDTVLFYRRRPSSLSAGSRSISTGQIPPTTLAEPETVRTRLAAEYAAWTQGCAAQRHRRMLDQVEPRTRAFLAGPLFHELAFAANRIDAAVEANRYFGTHVWTNLREPTHIGLAYCRLCEIVGNRRFTDVFLLPFFVRGGGEKYLLNVMHGLMQTRPGTSILVLTGEPRQQHDWLDRLPAGSAFVDLWQVGPDCTRADIELLTLKAIQALAPSARIHLKHCTYAFQFWNRFGRVLADSNRGILYRFLDTCYQDHGRRFLGGFEFDFISNNLDTFHAIVTDHRKIIDADRQRFDHRHEVWDWLPTECQPTRSPEQLEAAPSGWRRRLLWASRLDDQKRPHLLPLLAAALRRRGIQISIDVYGAAVLQNYDVAALSCEGLCYRGAFEAFEALDCEAYDGFIYTAEFDGLPNVVLEALGAGLPVIAPDIGGIAEVVQPGQTGWLLPSDGSEAALVDGFCDAIEALYSDPQRQRRMAVAAVRLIMSRHGRTAFLRRIERIFGD
ncbi:MAG TPA: glycosyltransferase [Acetobacteraceae bacterium]|nr:glycosyltransferase [Acetobacteraceae bacterium]